MRNRSDNKRSILDWTNRDKREIRQGSASMELPRSETPETYEYNDEGWDSDDSRYQESGVTFKSQRTARYISPRNIIRTYLQFLPL